ncbi:endonuclease domain-containing protein [Spirosoma jeollabukense]
MASNMFYGAPSQLFEKAKKLREAMTPAELVLWESLRTNKLNGFRFKAQHPIKYFIADFYSHAARLVIELDGSVHDSLDQQEYDTNRTYVLEEFGLTVIRFRNEEVMQNLTTVLSKIAKHLPK